MRYRKHVHRFTVPSAVGAMLAICLVLTGCGSAGDQSGTVSESVSENQKALWEEARTTHDGLVTVFIGSSGNQELDQLREMFNEDFPGVRLEWIAGTGDSVNERFVTERRAGLQTADVIANGGVSSFEPLEKEGFLEPFTPEEANLFTSVPGTYKEGLVYSFGNINLGVCYNPTKVTDEEIGLLQTYEGWTDPRWAGRSAILNDEGFGPRRSLTYWMFEDSKLGPDWLKRVAANRPIVSKSANTLAPQVIAGEYDVMFNSQTVQGPRAERQGAPLECTTAEYAPTYTFATALAQGAPNSPGGKLFINWIMSEDGQRAVQQTFAYNAQRKGFDEAVSEADWWRVPADERVVDGSVVTDNAEKLHSIVEETLGGTQS